ncbi:MAG: kynureninase, partial [Rhodospirillales bacterium]|nr:kynureninase [Rhodospirillales bacterium]
NTRGTALTYSHDELLAMDRADPYASLRDEFSLPDDVIYLDGNSLGPPVKEALDFMSQTTDFWRNDLIECWIKHDWFNLPTQIGGKLAGLVGAEADEVVCSDSVSVNLYKCLAAALRMRPDRAVVLSDSGNFPTDLYVMEGIAGEFRMVDSDAILSAIDESVAVVSMSHVDFRTSRINDMAAITRKAHDNGALVIWDLCHSVGAIPVDLNGVNADLAVGCTYKYLNGGPGAPAFMYVANRHQETIRQPIQGWWGHASPFEMTTSYQPDSGMRRMLSGTPGILSMATLSASLDVLVTADMTGLRDKAMRMGEVFTALVDERCQAYGLELGSPGNPEERGNHVIFSHPEGYAVVQALKKQNVIADFRSPHWMRFGFAPAYLSFADIGNAVDRLEHVLRTGAWDSEKFKTRAAVT